MRDRIPISPIHGLNASLSQCFYCLEDKNEIVIPGRLKGDVEAPRKAVWTMEPCDKCKDFMEKGVMLISIVDGQKWPNDNPVRSGYLCVVRDDAIRRMLERPERILKARYAFVDDSAWDAVGLPRIDTDERST